MLKTTEFIKTKSFKLAIYARGSIESDKIALVLPGKLDSKDYAHMHSHVELLATKGYYALTFDPPGTWESDGDIGMYTLSNYYQAINEVIEYYGNKPTLIVGHSKGGSMGMLTAINNKHVTRFVAIMSKPITIDKSKINKEWKNKGYIIHYRDTPTGFGEEETEFKLPYSYFEDEVQYDMTDDLKKCTKPKLFIVGSEYNAINAALIKKAFESSAEPKSFYSIKSKHDYRKDKDLIKQVNEIISTFIE